jgi:hypothetical protein
MKMSALGAQQPPQPLARPSTFPRVTTMPDRADPEDPSRLALGDEDAGQAARHRL